MPHFLEVTDRVCLVVEGYKSIHGLSHSPPTHMHPPADSETPDVAPTHSVSCGKGVSDQAITGVSAGDSTLSSSASSSWEGNLFLQGHRQGRGLQRG